MQPHLPTPSASSSSLSLSLSLFPSASAVAYLPLRRSRLSLTKPRRDAAERGRARNSSSTPAKHLRPFPHNIYPSSFPLRSSLFPLPAPTVGARLPPYVAVAFVCVCVYFCTHHAAPARPVWDFHLDFQFSVYRYAFSASSSTCQALRLMVCRA